MYGLDCHVHCGERRKKSVSTETLPQQNSGDDTEESNGFLRGGVKQKVNNDIRARPLTIRLGFCAENQRTKFHRPAPASSHKSMVSAPRRGMTSKSSEFKPSLPSMLSALLSPSQCTLSAMPTKTLSSNVSTLKRSLCSKAPQLLLHRV